MSTWNRTGTIAVTNGSATVTGTGVDWSDVSAGDALHAPGGAIYEIASVTGSTLALVDTYAGSTASGQTYAIQPTRGVLDKTRTTQRELIEVVEALVSEYGLPLVLEKGGTGAEDQAGARDNLGLVPTETPTDTTAGRLLKVGDSPGLLRGAGYLYVSEIRYTSGGTFAKASYPWLRAVRVRVQGAGGPGGGSQATAAGEASAGRGGGAGAYAESFVLAGALAASVTVTVGAAGVGVVGDAGTAGGASSFGGHAVAGGGSGGGVSAASSNPLAFQDDNGGAASAGNTQASGQHGTHAFRLPPSESCGGGGGASRFGRPGRGRRLTDGTPANGYGAGGGGASSAGVDVSRSGGNGAPGIVIVELYA